jgi:predicted DNA-binding ArsR family transcriptional regulator
LFNEELKDNYNEIESMISSHLDQTEEMKNIPKKEYKVGYFCSKIQVAASSTLLSYLNKMIHILLMIPDELKKKSFTR